MSCFVISDDVSFRRERFGGVALNRSRQNTRFFNASAARLIEECREAISVVPLIDRLGWRGQVTQSAVEQFIADQVTNAILQSASPGQRSRASLFNLDVDQFAGDHLHIPLGVEIELTLKCLRTCRYCAYEAHPKVSRESELSLADWEACLDKLSSAGVFFVRFTGGDPLVRPDFAEILARADRLGFVITVGSDLTRLTGEHVAVLAGTRNLYALQTTLDGATAETADLLRGPGNFASVQNGIRRLKAAGVPVIVGTVLNRRNVGEVGAIARLVGALGVDGYCVAPLYAAGRGTAASLASMMPTNDDLAVAARAVKQAVDNADVASADPAWLGATADAAASDLNVIWADQQHLARRPDSLMRIDPRGHVYVSIKLKKGLKEQVYVGNIADDELGYLWREAPLMKRLRAQPTRQSYFGPVIDVREVMPNEGGH